MANAQPGIAPVSRHLVDNPLRYCCHCDQRRRGSRDNLAVCSHCKRPLPIPGAKHDAEQEGV